MALEPLAPRPVDAPTEHCPECGSWLKPRLDGRIRRHVAGLQGTKPGHPDCIGSNRYDERLIKVVVASSATTPQVRMTVAGRRSAEVVARTYIERGENVALYLIKGDS